MNTLGAVRAAGVTLLVPVTAVFWGVVLLHESLSWPIVIGMAVILAGTVLTNLKRPARKPAVQRDYPDAAYPRTSRRIQPTFESPPSGFDHTSATLKV